MHRTGVLNIKQFYGDNTHSYKALSTTGQAGYRKEKWDVHDQMPEAY